MIPLFNYTILHQSFSDIHLFSPSLGAWVALFVALFLLFCSGFISASEIAFFSLSPNDKNEIEEEKFSSDTKIKSLLAQSERLLATILISNNLVNVAIIMLLNFFIHQCVDFGNAVVLEFLFMTVLLTFLLLLFGEIMPKIYSASHTLNFCRMAASTLCLLNRFWHPLSSCLISVKKFIERFQSHGSQSLTVDDLEKAMELTDQKDIAQESSMLQGIIRFGGETVREIMTPRMDIVDLDIKAPFSEVLDCILKNNYSRIPVYQKTQDNIKGVLYIKDLLPHLDKTSNFRWQTLIRPPYFVPETKMIDMLLRDFQENKVHMAIVVDEFGGTSGIVTMEDIIEEIVGEINDEYDEDERTFMRLNQHTYVFEAKTLLSDFCRVIQYDERFFEEIEGDADTLAGLLLEIKGDFPQIDEKITYKNLTFQAIEMDQRRIVKIKLIVGKTA